MLSGRVRVLPLGVALLGVALAAPARAYEDQLTAGIGAGYAYASGRTVPRHGALLDLTASVGLGPVWALRAHASYALHPSDRPLHAGLLGADVLYLIDVLEFVPYFGAGGSGVARARGDDLDLDLGVQLVVGVDYLISRELTLELEARPYLLLSDLDGAPFYGTVGAAVVFMFDG